MITKETVADHKYLSDQTTIQGASRQLGKAYIGGHPTVAVSMTGANKSDLSITVHSVTLPGNNELEVFIEQSNDKSNWFFAGQIANPITAAGTFSVSASNVGMAYVRALFVFDENTTQPTGVNAFVSAEMTTSLTPSP